MASKTKTKKCIYDNCVIPDNNNVYLLQLAFLVFGILGFVLLQNEFSFFNIFLFITPIALDLAYNDVKGKLLKTIKGIYFCVDMICSVLCFVGITMLKEDGLNVSSNIIYIAERVDLSAIKKFMLWVVIANMFIPIMFYFGRPCKKTQKTFDKFSKLDNKEEIKC